jgi:hypothetical protein
VIEINLEPTPVSGAVDVGLYGKAGEILPRVVAGAGPSRDDGSALDPP